MIDLPEDAQERKNVPVWTAFIKYFPHAIVAVAKHAANGSKQHHPNDPPWWDMSKSQDEMDALMRHALEGHHEAVAWRAMANLEREILNGYRPNEPKPNEDDLPTEPLPFSEWEAWQTSFYGCRPLFMREMYKEYLKGFTATRPTFIAPDGSF